MANFKKTVEQHPFWFIIGAFFAGLLPGFIALSLIYSGVIEKKDALIELLRDDKTRCENIVTILKVKVQNDSLKIAGLSKSLGKYELKYSQAKQKIILSDTTLCPGMGISIFDGNAIVSYWNYAEQGNIAQISLIAEGKLKITGARFNLYETGRESFTANNQEYVLNFLGFDQEKGNGCIKISIYKK